LFQRIIDNTVGERLEDEDTGKENSEEEGRRSEDEFIVWHSLLPLGTEELTPPVEDQVDKESCQSP